MEKEKVLLEAKFNPKVCTYWLLNGIIICTVTIVGIPFLPIWIVVGLLVTRKYLAAMSCTLTDRSLKVKKGLLVRVEKTVPLDKVTDLGLVQGPIMRALDLEALSVETAGQSGVGPLVSLTGIEGGRAFRDAVLEQRDKIAAAEKGEAPAQPTSSPDKAGVLDEIRDILLRIETRLADNSSGQ